MKIKEQVVIAALLIGSAVFSQTSFGIEQATATAGFLLLSAPPETSVKTPSREMPEHAMSRTTLKNIEDEKNEPVRDPAGNIQYVVTVTDSAPQAYAKPGVQLIAQDARFANWHAPEMVQVLHDLEHVYGFSATHLYSQTLNGFAAYLSETQVASLRKDARVRSAGAARKLEFSAGLWNDYTYGNEVLPWGVQSVGGGKASNYGATVYLVDSGVGNHPDINVVDRWAAPGTNLVGCYAHSTHVAGIVGGIRNNNGTIGVNSGTKIVSLAIGDKTCLPVSSANIIAAFDEAMIRIRQNGRVGVVNLSLNTENIFNKNQTSRSDSLVNSIRSLISPSPSTGYRGAFFVQSAGNQAADACVYAFNEKLLNDGAMVVGAIDNNGQPVRPLNGRGVSFINTFQSEPGSNYGNCVDVWAPGNKVYSTWFEQGVTSPTYAMLSGTSMAAPHVAGVAAYLIDSQPWLQTPSDVESAIRALQYHNGAVDYSGLPVSTLNLDHVQANARPTAEFQIAGNYGDSVSISRYSNELFGLSYDSAGAQSCGLKAWLNGAPWYEIPNFTSNYYWGSISLAPGQYRWEVTCRSPAGTVSTASAYAKIVVAPPTPTVSFYVDGVAVANDAIISRPYGQAFTLAYGSSNAYACNLSATFGYSPMDFPVPWYSVPNFYTSYNWGAVSLQRGRYAWQVTCQNSAGVTTSTQLKASIY